MIEQEIAEKFEILRMPTGSVAYGTAIDGKADRDEMGICVPPPEYVIGLETFDQRIHKTAKEGERSGPVDLDLTIFSLRKFVSLALKGNPTVLELLFVPHAESIVTSSFGLDLLNRRDMFLSRTAGRRYLGYLRSQLNQLTDSGKGKHTNRPELVEKFGIDTKFAYHAIRLGMQGAELLETGYITLPMEEPWRNWLIDLRQGRYDRQTAVDMARSFERKLAALIDISDLPEKANRGRANRWMIETHQRMWKDHALI